MKRRIFSYNWFCFSVIVIFSGIWVSFFVEVVFALNLIWIFLFPIALEDRKVSFLLCRLIGHRSSIIFLSININSLIIIKINCRIAFGT